MNTLEMMAALHKNPKLKFEHKKGDRKRVMRISNNGYFYLDIYKNDELIPDSLGGGGFNGNVNAEYEWELVREPVDFMTAINSGKRIRSEYWPEDQSVPMMVKGVSLQVCKLEINGKWFIED